MMLKDMVYIADHKSMPSEWLVPEIGRRRRSGYGDSSTGWELPFPETSPVRTSAGLGLIRYVGFGTPAANCIRQLI
jgi:hypothetical protein